MYVGILVQAAANPEQRKGRGGRKAGSKVDLNAIDGAAAGSQGGPTASGAGPADSGGGRRRKLNSGAGVTVSGS